MYFVFDENEVMGGYYYPRLLFVFVDFKKAMDYMYKIGYDFGELEIIEQLENKNGIVFVKHGSVYGNFGSRIGLIREDSGNVLEAESIASKEYYLGQG